jgi:hypothetical protein
MMDITSGFDWFALDSKHEAELIGDPSAAKIIRFGSFTMRPATSDDQEMRP